MSLTRHLVLFARAPRRGAVKRRLAADIGAGAALAFYRNTLRDVVWRLGRDPRWTTWLMVTPDAAAKSPGLWPPVPGVRLIGQGGGDLGARMAWPIRNFPPGPVVVVGSDIPDVTPEHVRDAFDALGRHDMVFGPASDGGYWLVGARRRPSVPKGLFSDVRWSTGHALGDTIAGLPKSCAVARIATLDDIDTGADWRSWRARPRRRIRRP
ncbi:MAG: TIGR04282 family arsenosugar biosynthesis glycosyltransferase [Alphaproteobacteria bacterium]|nr:TIGR04282 family arsenosugar biosynthesis glycosyltransferase [Alphaproteobacteria bacterium]